MVQPVFVLSSTPFHSSFFRQFFRCEHAGDLGAYLEGIFSLLLEQVTLTQTPNAASASITAISEACSRFMQQSKGVMRDHQLRLAREQRMKAGLADAKNANAYLSLQRQINLWVPIVRVSGTVPSSSLEFDLFHSLSHVILSLFRSLQNYVSRAVLEGAQQACACAGAALSLRFARRHQSFHSQHCKCGHVGPGRLLIFLRAMVVTDLDSSLAVTGCIL